MKVIEPQFQDKDRAVFRNEKEARVWCLVNALDNGFEYGEPEELETTMVRVTIKKREEK